MAQDPHLHLIITSVHPYMQFLGSLRSFFFCSPDQICPIFLINFLNRNNVCKGIIYLAQAA
jgi:hypothetical protein